MEETTNQPTLDIHLPDEAATLRLGEQLAAASSMGGIIYLQGELGAGKTTLARGLLRALGHQGTVKSPTYALMEPYVLGAKHIYHLDLYRLVDPEELEYLGMRDFLSDDALCLVEWPERGKGWLPTADMTIQLKIETSGRCAHLCAHTARGKALLS